MATTQKSDLPTSITNKNRAGYIKLAQNYRAKHGSLKGFTNKYGYGYWANKDGNFTLYYPDIDNSIKGNVKPKSYVGRLSQKHKDRIRRDNSSLRQLYGEDNFPKPTDGLQAHHKRKISQYAPFFEGASLEEARELARYAAEDLGSPLSNRAENAELIPERAHTKHHNWERKQGYTPQGFSDLTKDGPFPSDFSNADIDTRKYALNRFLSNEQPSIDANLERVKLDHDGLGVKRGQASVQWLSPEQLTRRRVARLALLGLAAPSVLGTAASAVETADRTNLAVQTGNPLDYVQAGVSGLSLAADHIPVVGEFISTPADLANTMIDQHRNGGSTLNGSGNGSTRNGKNNGQVKVGTNNGNGGRSGAKRRAILASKGRVSVDHYAS